MTLWTVALQARLSMGFSRQEYWSGLPCPSLRDGLWLYAIVIICIFSICFKDFFLHILYTNPTLNRCFVNIFSQPKAYLFREQQILTLMKFNLSVFSFMDCVFGVYLQSHHQTQGDLDFLLCLLIEAS